MLVILLQPALLVLVMSIVFRYVDTSLEYMVLSEHCVGDPSTDTSGACSWAQWVNAAYQEIKSDFLPTQTMIFMLSLSCLWFGMSAAVRELIADQIIFLRERRIGLGVFPYVLSKVFVLGVITAIQVIALSGSIFYIFTLSKYGFSLPMLLGVSCMTAWLGVSVGLCISSMYKSSEAAVGTIPLLLIPFIAFSTIMYGLRDMTPFANAVSDLIPQRYTFDAFVKTGEELAVRSYQGDYKAQPISGTLWKLGLKETDKVADVGYSLPELSSIIVGLSIVLLGLTIMIVWAKGRKTS